MSKETILRIRETEKKAAELIEEAEADARAMRMNAEEEGKRLCLETEKKVAAELEAMTERIRGKADELIQRSEEEAKAEADALEASVKVSRKAAEDALVGRLMEKCR